MTTPPLDAADKDVEDVKEEDATDAPRTAATDRVNGDGEKACTEISTVEARHVRTNNFILSIIQFKLGMSKRGAWV